MPTFGPRLDGENPDEELSIEEMTKMAARWQENSMKEFAEMKETSIKMSLLWQKFEKNRRKPLGMPDDKPKRSLPKSED